MKNFPTELLKEWFLNNRRSLPWREEPTPYKVWISEVMLQQTQVAVVIPYFEKWMRTFPTIEALAHSPLDEVLKCWEGLGYYSRARYLLHAARCVVEKFQGELPSQPKQLAQIKGIGPYTQGAIRSFAFRQKAAAVDGNVLRVLSRFLAIEEEIDRPSVRKSLVDYAEALLPDHEPWLITEGLIELGAMVCAKKAKCPLCPLRRECLAHRHSLQGILPKKRERLKTIFLSRIVAVIRFENHYLLQRGEKGKVMADLYEFPYLESDAGWESRLETHVGIPLKYIKPLPMQQQSFTRYRVKLFPHLLQATQLGEQLLWKTEEELKNLPFSSGHRRIVENLFL